jgi:hypothetical protein
MFRQAEKKTAVTATAMTRLIAVLDTRKKQIGEEEEGGRRPPSC